LPQSSSAVSPLLHPTTFRGPRLPGNDTVGLPRANNPYALLANSGLETLVSESASSLRFND
jgi:hypothetical protein